MFRPSWKGPAPWFLNLGSWYFCYCEAEDLYLSWWIVRRSLPVLMKREKDWPSATRRHPILSTIICWHFFSRFSFVCNLSSLLFSSLGGIWFFRQSYPPRLLFSCKLLFWKAPTQQSSYVTPSPEIVNTTSMWHYSACRHVGEVSKMEENMFHTKLHHSPLPFPSEQVNTEKKCFMKKRAFPKRIVWFGVCWKGVARFSNAKVTYLGKHLHP